MQPNGIVRLPEMDASGSFYNRHLRALDFFLD